MTCPGTYSWHQITSRPEDYRREVERLYRLPNRWLAEELLRLARRALDENPNPERGAWLISEALTGHIPELARRLGAKVPGHMLRHNLANMSAANLRHELSAGVGLGNLCSGLPVGEVVTPGLSAVALLDIDPLEGNPIATALDRIWMPENPESDLIASSNLEFSALYCDRVFSSWSPEVRQLNMDEVDHHAVNMHMAKFVAEAEGCSVEDAYREMFGTEA
jgi:hypothetical protein